VSPDLKRFEDGQKFLIVNVIIEFRRRKGAGMKSDRMNVVIRGSD
jgi:hypothetical protein